MDGRGNEERASWCVGDVNESGDSSDGTYDMEKSPRDSGEGLFGGEESDLEGEIAASRSAFAPGDEAAAAASAGDS